VRKSTDFAADFQRQPDRVGPERFGGHILSDQRLLQAHLNARRVPAMPSLGPAEAGVQTESTSASVATAGAAANESKFRRARIRKASRRASSGSIRLSVSPRDALRKSISRTNDLIRSFRRQRQQSQLVRTTRASLKQLRQSG
jgi:hypothetical protein